MEPEKVITHSGTCRRTPMAEDVQEILRQNSKILELNGRILSLIIELQMPKVAVDLSDHTDCNYGLPRK